MKKILLILIFLCGANPAFGQEFAMPTDADYPVLPKSAARPADFIPRDWKLISEAEGDLNGDKRKDFVLVIKANQEKFLNKNDGLGTDVFDTNPRILAILFWENDRYKLALQSNTFIAMPDSPTMSEPFSSVKTENGVLRFDFEIFLSAGGWGMSNTTYKFRFQNEKFVLIGADKTEIQRNTGEMETRSYNFVTGKVQVTNGSISGKPKDKVRWKNINLKELKTLETLNKPFEWEIEKDYFL